MPCTFFGVIFTWERCLSPLSSYFPGSTGGNELRYTGIELVRLSSVLTTRLSTPQVQNVQLEKGAQDRRRKKETEEGKRKHKLELLSSQANSTGYMALVDTEYDHTHKHIYNIFRNIYKQLIETGDCVLLRVSAKTLGRSSNPFSSVSPLNPLSTLESVTPPLETSQRRSYCQADCFQARASFHRDLLSRHRESLCVSDNWALDATRDVLTSDSPNDWMSARRIACWQLRLEGCYTGSHLPDSMTHVHTRRKLLVLHFTYTIF